MYLHIYAAAVTVLLACTLVPPLRTFVTHHAVQHVPPLRAAHLAHYLMAPMQLQALGAVVEAGVFEHIEAVHKNAPRSVKQLAAELQLDEATLRTCVNNLVMMHMIDVSESRATGEQLVRLSKLSRTHLLASSPESMVDMVRLLSLPYTASAAAVALPARLRTGALPPGAEHAETPGHHFWADFARLSDRMARSESGDVMVAMAKAGVFPRERETATPRILDSACGSGGVGAAMLEWLPAARMVFFDLPHVIALTEAQVAKNYAASVVERSQFVGGDLFKFDHEKMGAFDFVLASHILHHFSVPSCVELAKTYFKALRPGAWLVAVEMLRDNDNLPSHFDVNTFPTFFDLVMRATTRSGLALSVSTIKVILREAGFVDVSVSGFFPKPYSAVFARRPV